MMTVNTSDDRTIEQLRAADALAKIKGIEGKDCGHYVSYVSGLPATIVMNGLGQALATLLAQSKGKDEPHKWLHDHVASWLAKQMPQLGADESAVVQGLMNNNQEVYLQAQGEAMAYLQWLKQFARAYLSEPEGPK